VLVDARDADELRRHYLIERELASRLRQAPRRERLGLYRSVYDELFRRVPRHPQLQAKSDPERLERRRRDVDRQLGFLRRFLGRDTVFMEIGAGDCALAAGAAPHVRRVYAIDVSEEIVRRQGLRPNVHLLLSDGCSVPVPPGSVDLAFSDQLMEHLHPDDAEEQLRNIYLGLAPGGAYVVVTPNRYYGPSDVSRGFEPVAAGLHLREYSARELRALLRRAGFARVGFYAGARGLYVRFPFLALVAIEKILEALPERTRLRVAGWAPMRALLGLRVVAFKR
jgi:SAM-dependent methyltransferase